MSMVLPMPRGALKRKANPPTLLPKRNDAHIIRPEQEEPLDLSVPSRARARLNSVGSSGVAASTSSNSSNDGDTECTATKKPSGTFSLRLRITKTPFAALHLPSTLAHSPPNSTSAFSPVKQAANNESAKTQNQLLAEQIQQLLLSNLMTPQQILMATLMGECFEEFRRENKKFISAGKTPPLTPQTVLPRPVLAPMLTAIQLPGRQNQSSDATVSRSPPKKQRRLSVKVSPSSSGGSAASTVGTEEPEDSEYVINPATGKRVRRNYKNMTMERRREANARERSRVHTIGAAFEKLRVLVPTTPPDDDGALQEVKLSKLSVLRIACK